MDIEGTRSEGLVSVTSMLARVAVAKNQENRELISQPAPKDDAQDARGNESFSDNTANASIDAPNPQVVSDNQTVGLFVNVVA